jgi:hypothetical protein
MLIPEVEEHVGESERIDLVSAAESSTTGRQSIRACHVTVGLLSASSLGLSELVVTSFSNFCFN